MPGDGRVTVSERKSTMSAIVAHPMEKLIVSIGEPMVEFNQTRPGERYFLQGFGGDTSNIIIAVGL